MHMWHYLPCIIMIVIVDDHWCLSPHGHFSMASSHRIPRLCRLCVRPRLMRTRHHCHWKQPLHGRIPKCFCLHHTNFLLRTLRICAIRSYQSSTLRFLIPWGVDQTQDQPSSDNSGCVTANLPTDLCLSNCGFTASWNLGRSFAGTPWPILCWLYIISGIQSGFRIGFNHPMHHCCSSRRNMLSASQFPHIICKHLDTELAINKMVTPVNPDVLKSIWGNS